MKTESIVTEEKSGFLIDVEGCLSTGKKLPIDIGGAMQFIYTYCQLARKGGLPPIGVCTGRPQPYAEAIVQMMGAFFPGYPSIVENGCYLYDPVDDVLIPNPAIEGKEGEIKEVKAFLEKEMIGKRLCKAEPGKELCISLNPILGMPIEELFNLVNKTLPPKMSELVFVTHSASAVDITPKGVNKATGLKFFCERTGIDPANLVGIGDTAGDFPLLEVVGYPACPSNSAKVVLDLVTKRKGYAAKKQFTAGVWEIILHFTGKG
jgi:hydroxymethylpyrimidine pyrophosphatase-like HAD family hydrolase